MRIVTVGRAASAFGIGLAVILPAGPATTDPTGPRERRFHLLNYEAWKSGQSTCLLALAEPDPVPTGRLRRLSDATQRRYTPMRRTGQSSVDRDDRRQPNGEWPAVDHAAWDRSSVGRPAGTGRHALARTADRHDTQFTCLDYVGQCWTARPVHIQLDGMRLHAVQLVNQATGLRVAVHGAESGPDFDDQIRVPNLF